MKRWGTAAAVAVVARVEDEGEIEVSKFASEVSKFESEPVLAVSTVGRVVGGREVADGRLEQFSNFPGRQLSQNCFAFTQAQPLQDPDLLHLQHPIYP